MLRCRGGKEPGKFFLEMTEYYKYLWASGGIIGWGVSGTGTWRLVQNDAILLIYNDVVEAFGRGAALIPVGYEQSPDKLRRTLFFVSKGS